MTTYFQDDSLLVTSSAVVWEEKKIPLRSIGSVRLVKGAEGVLPILKPVRWCLDWLDNEVPNACVVIRYGWWGGSATIAWSLNCPTSDPNLYLYMWEQQHGLGRDHRLVHCLTRIKEIIAKYDHDFARALPELRSNQDLVGTVDLVCTRTESFARLQRIEAAVRQALGE